MQRQAIVQCARGWIGTRFVHQGRLKKTLHHHGGCDCLGLLVGVAKELRLAHSASTTALASHDQTEYGRIPDARILRNGLAAILQQIPIDDIVPADVLLLELDGNPQHLAIVSDHPQGLGIIHAFAAARGVVEHRLDESWRRRIVAAYTLL